MTRRRPGVYVASVASTDKAVRAIMETAYPRVVEWLLGEGHGAGDVEMEPSNLLASELHADAIISVASDRIVHIEFQGYPDARIAWRMAVYGARIMERYGTYPTQFLIGVHRAAGRLPSSFISPFMQCHWTAVHLWEQPAEDLLRHVPELAVLARPGAGGPEPLLASVMAWVRQIDDQDERAKTLALVATLAASAYPEARLQSWLRRNVMGNAGIIERSFFAQSLIERGVQQGREQGVEIGREQGVEIGREQGERGGQLKLVRMYIETALPGVPAETMNRIDRLPTDALDDLAEVLFGGASPTDVAEWLDAFEASEG